MFFQDALKAIREGKKATNKLWKEKNEFLFYSDVQFIPYDKLEESVKRFVKKEDVIGKEVMIHPHIAKKTGDGNIMVGWTPNQSDMLGDFWNIVE